MPKTTKKILVAFPLDMVEEMAPIQKLEHRSCSGLIRECVRSFLDRWRREQRFRAGVLPESPEVTPQEVQP